MDRSIKRKITKALLILVFSSAVLQTASAYASEAHEDQPITCKEDLNHEWIRIGVGEGTASEQTFNSRSMITQE